MKHILVFILILIPGLTPGASAQSPGLTPGANINEEIIVTASALPETVEATPAAVTVITKDEIDDRAARDVADVLREVPGITMSRTGSRRCK